MLRSHVVAAIENCWRDGLTARSAAYELDLSVTTVLKYFRRFRIAHVPRGELRRIHHVNDGWPKPYDGPEWIGKAIDDGKTQG